LSVFSIKTFLFIASEGMSQIELSSCLHSQNSTGLFKFLFCIFIKPTICTDSVASSAAGKCFNITAKVIKLCVYFSNNFGDDALLKGKIFWTTLKCSTIRQEIMLIMATCCRANLNSDTKKGLLSGKTGVIQESDAEILAEEMME
jgi:hypothetical protein